DLQAAQLLWATVDSPWVHNAHSDRYFSNVRAMRALQAEAVYSTHLPPAVGIAESLCDVLAAAPDTDPFVGPDQHALEAMLAAFQQAAG
ncbi:MAG TPA: MBL fold metallo-hydrolase, partial [Mycobacterium sp.]|nr:MBL fold metallo-hydrolase [Mycobacterium sp.]